MRRYSRKKNSIRIFSAVTVFAALIFAASYYFAGKKGRGIVVAKVNDQEIFQSEIEQKLRSIFDDQGEEIKIPAIDNLPKEVLDILIKETYLDKELSKLAKRSEVIGDKEVQGRIAEVENKILRQSYINLLVKQEVTDQQVSAKYAEISANLAGKKEYAVLHIVTKTKVEAETLRKKITAKKKAIKFSDVAKKYSLDQESAEHGGELGFVLEDNMIKEISDAIVTLQQNEISTPIQTKFGWHLVKFTEVREAQVLSFDSVKQNIRKQLEQDKINEIEAKIIKDVKIEILLKPKELEEVKPEAKEAKPETEEVKPEAMVPVEQVLQEPVTEQQNVEEQIELEQQTEKKDEEVKAKEAKHDKKHRR